MNDLPDFDLLAQLLGQFGGAPAGLGQELAAGGGDLINGLAANGTLIAPGLERGLPPGLLRQGAPTPPPLGGAAADAITPPAFLEGSPGTPPLIPPSPVFPGVDPAVLGSAEQFPGMNPLTQEQPTTLDRALTLAEILGKGQGGDGNGNNTPRVPTSVGAAKAYGGASLAPAQQGTTFSALQGVNQAQGAVTPSLASILNGR